MESREGPSRIIWLIDEALSCLLTLRLRILPEVLEFRTGTVGILDDTSSAGDGILTSFITPAISLETPVCLTLVSSSNDRSSPAKSVPRF